MAISNGNSVEENLPILSDNLNDLVCKQINLFLENKMNVLKETSQAVNTNGSSRSRPCKMYHLTFVILTVVIVVCTTLLIVYSPLFKERTSMNPTRTNYQVSLRLFFVLFFSFYVCMHVYARLKIITFFMFLTFIVLYRE